MKPLLKNVLLLWGSVAEFFIILELSLAISSPHKLKIRPYHEKYDPVMGWVNKEFVSRLLLIDLGLADEYTSNIGSIPVLTNPPEAIPQVRYNRQ